MKKKKSFDAKYYRNLVETLHDARRDLTSTSTRISRYEEKLRQHNWQPTLEEMEDKWAQEPRPKLRITNPPNQR